MQINNTRKQIYPYATIENLEIHESRNANLHHSSKPNKNKHTNIRKTEIKKENEPKKSN
jgi:hypothetical protein